MGLIPLTEARSIYTSALAAKFKETVQVMSFLRSFFKEQVFFTKYISIEVQRATEQVAVDVFRGSPGNRVFFGDFSQKKFLPPYYRMFFDATELDLYDRVAGMLGGDDDNGQIEAEIMAEFVQMVTDKYAELQKLVDRAIEIQCSQVFHSGIIQIAQGTNIDFKRKAASMYDPGAGQYFANAIDPFEKLGLGMKFLREKGKVQGPVQTGIFGEGAWNDLLTNTVFKERNDLVNLGLDKIQSPARDAAGGNYMGRLTVGSYLLDCWTYVESYEKKISGVKTHVPYIEEDKVIIIPQNPNFTLNFAAVPQLIGDGAKKGKYIRGEFKDFDNSIHKMDLKSAPVAVPVQVDGIYTLKAKA